MQGQNEVLDIVVFGMMIKTVILKALPIKWTSKLITDKKMEKENVLYTFNQEYKPCLTCRFPVKAQLDYYHNREKIIKSTRNASSIRIKESNLKALHYIISCLVTIRI